MPKLTGQLLFEASFPNFKQTYMSQLVIHGTKHHKDNQWQSQELRYRIFYLRTQGSPVVQSNIQTKV